MEFNRSSYRMTKQTSELIMWGTHRSRCNAEDIMSPTGGCLAYGSCMRDRPDTCSVQFLSFWSYPGVSCLVVSCWMLHAKNGRLLRSTTCFFDDYLKGELHTRCNVCCFNNPRLSRRARILVSQWCFTGTGLVRKVLEFLSCRSTCEHIFKPLYLIPNPATPVCMSSTSAPRARTTPLPWHVITRQVPESQPKSIGSAGRSHALDCI